MSVCFVVPYFGKFPETFPFWLKSCEKNKDFNWLIITDDKREFLFPQNVKVIYSSLDEMIKKFEEKLGFKINLENPYKLCDYRPLYGVLFEEQLIDYTHWGYTDIDTIWGDLSKFITAEMLEEYDKIQKWGHLSIYKNELSINRAFMDCDYQRILTNQASFIFDEPSRTPNINELLIARGKKILGEIKYADIKVVCYNMKFIHSLKRTEEKPKYSAIFEYNDGKVFAYCNEDGIVKKEEFAYVHFQKRKILSKIKTVEKFLLVPNEIIKWQTVNIDFLKKFEHDKYIYHIQKIKNLIIWRLKNEIELRKSK